MELIVAIILLIIGIACHIKISRNRFYRMSSGGVQQFSSYSKMLLITTFEKMLFLLEACAFVGSIFAFIIWLSK
ncbi:MAG: hypothetical protein JW871_02535 [Endomicrobiales bacterium]|nr:hypothetical protein [Endomicrobiales bacterium]